MTVPGDSFLVQRDTSTTADAATKVDIAANADVATNTDDATNADGAVDAHGAVNADVATNAEASGRVDPPREKRYRALVSYDGGSYFGWQLQPDHATVQGELERALKKIVERNVRVHGAGRTDSGVHALGQVASFNVATRIPLGSFRSALNWHLSPDVRVHVLDEAPAEFHPRFDAQWREYAYVLVTEGSPFTRRYAHVLRAPVDVARMNEACLPLLGEHDFRAFTTQPEGPYGCHMLAASWRETPTGVVFEVRASRFLYRMVRLLVTACLDVGRGKLPVEGLQERLASGSHRPGPGPAPGHGLYLISVGYDPEWPVADAARAIGPLGLRAQSRR